MSRDIYIFEISRAEDGEAIRSLVADANADDSLFATDKEEIGQAAQSRFAGLNAQCVNTRPRWDGGRP